MHGWAPVPPAAVAAALPIRLRLRPPPRPMRRSQCSDPLRLKLLPPAMRPHMLSRPRVVVDYSAVPAVLELGF